MNTEPTISPTRQAAVNGLAAVGFIALIVAGIWLAVYSTRFVPTIVNRMGAAAVYLGSIFTPAEPGLSVVPTPNASTTIPFDTASSTSTNLTPKSSEPKSTQEPKPVQPTPAPAVVKPAPYGLADLTVRVIAKGYQTSESPMSFVPGATVPSNTFPAVKILVKNIGTNYSGTWNLRASSPRDTSPAISQIESFAPGEEREFTAFLDRARSGSEQTITITANFDNMANESNFGNNEVSAALTIE